MKLLIKTCHALGCDKPGQSDKIYNKITLNYFRAVLIYSYRFFNGVKNPKLIAIIYPLPVKKSIFDI